MRKLLLVIALVATARVGAAQSVIPRIQDVDLNDIRGAVQATGTLWWDFNNARFEVPKRTSPTQPYRGTVFAANLWIGGVDNSGTLYVAGETYRQQNSGAGQTELSFTSGPIAASYPNQVPFYGDPAYDHVWKISRSELLDLQQNYQQPGYQVPAGIAQWPAAGNVTGGRAPFVDVNQDGVYSPMSGDYPDFPGDQALYFIVNDEAQLKVPFTPAMGAEVQGFVYTFDAAGSGNALDQTIFVRYNITNHSTRDYHAFYFGHWVDFDLGNFNDDYVGCDRARQMMYVYNGDSLDEDFLYNNGQGHLDTIRGYGANPPAQAVTLLSDPMAGFTYYNNDFSVNGNPRTAMHFYNYLHGKITTGQDLMYGGNGVAGTNGQPYPWMFDGDPVAGTGWTERSAGNVPGDRRGLITAGPYTLTAGASHSFELAYVFGQSPQRGVNPGVLQLRQKIDAIHSAYTAGTLGAARATEPAAIFSLAPNPASRAVTVHAALPVGVASATLTLRDGLGRPVRTLSVRGGATGLNLRGLAAGLYHATLSTQDGRALASQRLVVAAE